MIRLPRIIKTKSLAYAALLHTILFSFREFNFRENRSGHHFGVFIVNFGHILKLFFSVSIVDFKYVFFCWKYQ